MLRILLPSILLSNTKLSHFHSHPANLRADHILIPELKAPSALSSLAHMTEDMMEKRNLVLLIFKALVAHCLVSHHLLCDPMCPAGLSWR